MTAQFARGPQPRATQPQNAPHAALLIDFDNVTMGIRSDLTKELKNLLNSDIIKGKVAVQRAYADWRRYPQYIVPLAENSVDLIFAPAYGSSKKNATDIRLAIDALELVFTRPEIGTFILLSGDSDFSSLVLKLKEYGKYVIGVGIRESSSDLLVQNCDEYYSYSGLTGLTRAGDEVSTEKFDPWELVEIAVRQMVDQRDVMRSDRLKQILLELDPNFDEKALGFTKFNRFLQEAANKGLLHLKKMENGQFEVGPVLPGLESAPLASSEPRRGRRGPRSAAPAPQIEVKAESDADVATEPVIVAPIEAMPVPRAAVPAPAAMPESARREALLAPLVEVKPAEVLPDIADDLQGAYALLQRATGDLSRGRSGPVRDSDLKRRMLELRPGFDEGAYGFSKFSRFLRQAHDAEVINLQKVENGSYEVTPGSRAVAQRGPVGRQEAEAPVTREAEAGTQRPEERGRRDRGRGRDRRHREPIASELEGMPIIASGAEAEPAEPGRAPARPEAAPSKAETIVTREAAAAPRVETVAAREVAAPPVAAAPAPRAAPAPPPEAPAFKPSAAAATAKPGVSLGFRRGSRGGSTSAAPPPILAGQTIQPVAPPIVPAAAMPEPVQVPAPVREEKPATRARSGKPAPTPAAAAGKVSAPAAAGKRAPAASAGKRAPAASAGKRAPAASADKRTAARAATDGKQVAPAPLDRFSLPAAEAEVVDRLAGYKGVGRKSAEATVQAFGASDVFRILREQPDRVREALGTRRAEPILKGWVQDLAALDGSSSENRGSAARKKRPVKQTQIEVFTEAPAAAARKKTRRGGRKNARKKAGVAK